MPTLRAAADLLSAASDIDSLGPLAAGMGCSGTPLPLDRDTTRALGIDDFVIAARVASGAGAMRALLVSMSDSASLREALPVLASRLAARAPHVLWVLVATQHATGAVALAAWTNERRPPRLAALIANRARIVDSDAETLRALGAVDARHDLLAHSRYVDILGREALGARFYRALDTGVRGLAASSHVGTNAARAELALLDTSRLLFLSFLEAKGWLNGDPAFLRHQFEQCATGGGRFHQRVLRSLFFGTLNTPVRARAPRARAFGGVPFLNGGLFARTALEQRHKGLAFSDDAYGRLIYELFGQYRFTAREETSAWTEAAIDPEMLGRAFESLMAHTERRRTGAFFTPFSLVERVTTLGLNVALEHTPLDDLTVLDPACGSGAFLVHALERIADLHIRRELETTANHAPDVSVVRRRVLTRSIFGVDVNATAVWLCELRLWLSVVIESTATDPATVMPLPNLDRNIRVGDSLSGNAFGDQNSQIAGSAAIRRLRQRYSGASGPRKDALAKQLDRAERVRARTMIDAELLRVAARRRDLLGVQRGRDLFGERYRASRDERVAADALRGRAAALRAERRHVDRGGALPFAFQVHCADVAAQGGFGLVIGNPPWVRLHHVDANRRAAFRRDYQVAMHAAWEPGAGHAGAGRGFAAQVDLAAIFVERATQLLRPRGALSLLVPAKLWRSLAGGGVRRWLATETSLRCVEDYSEAEAAFDAAVYPSLIVAQRTPSPASSPCVNIAVHHRGQTPFTWTAARSSLPLDDTPGAPWILLPPDARAAFDSVRAAGNPLAATTLGRPLLGVKCGCNDAFIVDLVEAGDDLADVRTCDDKIITIERHLLRPLLRGEALRRWTTPPTNARVIWTHDARGVVLSSLPPHAARWMARWRRALGARADAYGSGPWWSLFRTDAARFDLPRVVWGDIGREPRAAVLAANDNSVPLNSCYAIRCSTNDDAHAFAALLNSPLARAWLAALAEPARGGYHRYLGWTLSQLPIPLDWNRARLILAACGTRAAQGDAPGERALFDVAVESFGPAMPDASALVAWAE